MTDQNPSSLDSTDCSVAEIPVLVGRQPIFGRDLVVQAYELLYRDSEENEAHFESGDEATALVLSNTFVDVGLDLVTGDKPAFINFTQSLIVSNTAMMFPPERLVCEVLEDVVATPEILKSLRALKEAGYRIALDDFQYQESLVPLVELADIIKLDILRLGLDGATEQLELLRPFDVEFLAEKVETFDEFETCREMGFDYFQGYFLCRPQIIEGSKPTQGGLGIIQLLACLNNPEADEDELEFVISRDAKLSYRLLRYINSAAFALAGTVGSVRHALNMLGHRTVRNWANLIVLTSVRGKSSEVMTTAFLRARMCELIAVAENKENPDEYFTVGLFSVLDALLGLRMESILEPLPLAENLNRALLGFEGDLGAILRAVINHELRPGSRLPDDEIDPNVVRKAFFASLEWVPKVISNTASD